ncbi:hypothetical protein J4E93_001259 [Alternaria ventricosa]|uniref:uncharacterized protein n=1 Tax=Alternaria ventricosa TaxID=1187951 RepID=UPI0020C5484E|nr:uncharacterized protein J4E93_001259 [Alternaria ventricosa]KAI4653493.1 hypothetical protein J4E93_001259 [Alternaria ventricosa]
MTPITDPETPTIVGVTNCSFDNAALLLDVHNAMVELEDKDDAIKYATILKFDGEMRAFCAEKLPKCFSPRTPNNPSWPPWVIWARRLHQASIHHKIIMIHQHFLSKSFKDVRYTYSRWACMSASQSLISLYTTRDAQEPQWWVEQAFIITAGICLILELFHRAEADAEVQECQLHVTRAIRYLQSFHTSSVAVHGVRLLMSLMAEYEKLRDGSDERTAVSADTAATQNCSYIPGNTAGIPTPDNDRATQQLPLDPEVPLSFDDPTMWNFDIDSMSFENLMDYLPSEGSLNTNVFNASMLSANGWPIGAIMSQDPELDKMLVLDALSSGLNMSMTELLSILGRQAPISNLLLGPVIRPQQIPVTAASHSEPSMHLQQKAPAAERPQEMLREFHIVYWTALALVSLIAISAVWTKVHMAAQKGRKSFEAKKPMSDVEKWHMRRQKARDEASMALGQVDDQSPGT